MLLQWGRGLTSTEITRLGWILMSVSIIKRRLYPSDNSALWTPVAVRKIEAERERRQCIHRPTREEYKLYLEKCDLKAKGLIGKGLDVTKKDDTPWYRTDAVVCWFYFIGAACAQAGCVCVPYAQQGDRRDAYPT
jgi:hypothetical protein